MISRKTRTSLVPVVALQGPLSGMSLQDCVAALNDDVYSLILEMYLSLETVEAKALCTNNRYQRKAEYIRAFSCITLAVRSFDRDSETSIL